MSISYDKLRKFEDLCSIIIIVCTFLLCSIESHHSFLFLFFQCHFMIRQVMRGFYIHKNNHWASSLKIMVVSYNTILNSVGSLDQKKILLVL